MDWEKLARALGTIEDHPDGSGWTEHGTGDSSERALELLVGQETLRSAVDHYVRGRPGGLLARTVLQLLPPSTAIERCREIYDGDDDIQIRRFAVNLLVAVGDRRVLPWVAEFLEDSDPEIQIWGACILDQLLWSELTEPAEAEELLARAGRHPNDAVREQAAFVRGYLEGGGALTAPRGLVRSCRSERTSSSHRPASS